MVWYPKYIQLRSLAECTKTKATITKALFKTKHWQIRAFKEPPCKPEFFLCPFHKRLRFRYQEIRHWMSLVLLTLQCLSFGESWELSLTLTFEKRAGRKGVEALSFGFPVFRTTLCQPLAQKKHKCSPIWTSS